ncbi:MAG TPA: aminotransferase class V-fold PLP-dependent enzyme, partial [Chthonomonadaceae bacterium]|nr:aminotransferase class V-fold PLP-dependent enzyme [Chthonomonadaceae bacterium]
MDTLDTPIYLDHAATTPVDPAVAQAMLPFLNDPNYAGNASSIHRFGREARAAIDTARDAVAALIGADYAEIYFTGSGTEADNLALFGTLLAAKPDRDHLVTTEIEHHAVLHTAHFLETLGFSVTRVPAGQDGLVDPEAIARAMTERTALVSVMHANNEIGTIQPIAEIARIAHTHGAKFHTDAVQTPGLLPVDVRTLECDLLSLSAHKLYGPKGIGTLYIRMGTKVSPILHGGAQEREKRAG